MATHSDDTSKKASSKVAHLSDVMPDSVREMAEQARNKASEIGDQATEAMENVRDAAEDLLGEAERLAKKHPVAAVLTGFGIGVLLGSWLNRK